jgi:hypothetical protein
MVAQGVSPGWAGKIAPSPRGATQDLLASSLARCRIRDVDGKKHPDDLPGTAACATPASLMLTLLRLQCAHQYYFRAPKEN